jgi:hypothetical protein
MLFFWAAFRAFHYKAHHPKAFQPRVVAASVGRHHNTGFKRFLASRLFVAIAAAA